MVFFRCNAFRSILPSSFRVHIDDKGEEKGMPSKKKKSLLPAPITDPKVQKCSDFPCPYTPEVYKDLKVHKTSVPSTLQVGKELGRGSNNRVFSARMEGEEEELVFRVPRKRSDTQERGSAVWEFRHTARASELGCCPPLKKCWIAKHSNGEWPSGLYMVCKRYKHDLDKFLSGKKELTEIAMEKRDKIGEQISGKLSLLARDFIFVFDLKPSNLVIEVGEDGEPDVRIIDFGRDFCEWGVKHGDATSSSPHITMVRRRVEAEYPSLGEEEREVVVSHIIFACMLVVLAATTTITIYEDRDKHKMDKEGRKKLNPVSPFAKELLESMTNRNLSILKELMRMDDVRGVFKHYHGRSWSGTRRTFRLAKGEER